MRPSLLHSLRHFAFYASGFLVGSALFCGAYMWSYQGTFPGIIVALALPVALFYFALLAVIRWRRPVLIGRAVFVLWNRRWSISDAGFVADLHVAVAVCTYALCGSHHDSRGNCFFELFCHTLDESDPCSLTNRWSQPLAVAIRTFDFMKQFSKFAALALASGGSAPSR